MIMRRLRQVSIAAIVGVPTLTAMQAASTAQAGSIAGSYSLPPGEIIYTYVTPEVSIYGAVEVGGHPSANVTQSSAHNYAVIGQVGISPSAKVKQIGSVNLANITQIGHWTNALTIQFGNMESVIGP
ncbi:MAG: hypothetical protein ABSC72_12535 [Methylovirgula sp.]|jgi:hypothetical protein